MKYRGLTASLFFMALAILNVPAQTPPQVEEIKPPIKTLGGGVLNGMAISLPRPEVGSILPHAVGAGTVTVYVTIDETGKVISAAAIAGHPVLRKACENAAKQARFKPTLISSTPLKISGVLVYDFSDKEIKAAEIISSTKTDNGHILNGKAVSLPAPAFPATAVAVGAGGPVNVQVIVDENGDVISAEAVSGHPLLKAAAVEAAKKAKFKSIVGVKASGILVYNFAGKNDGAKNNGADRSPGSVKTEGKQAQPKIISKGVINGVALSLPKPAFPATAKAVNASGAVSVKVIIDVDGSVISAEAVSGHPLLRGESVEAAQQAKFQPVLIGGEPVRVSGVIVYNFVPPLSWRQVGYEMSIAEQAQYLSREFPAGAIGAWLPEDWSAEKEIVTKLSAKSTYNSVGVAQGQVHLANGTVVDLAEVDHKQLLGSLKTLFESRLSLDQGDLLDLKLGMLLGRLSQSLDDDTLRMALSELRQFESSGRTSDAAKMISSLGEFANKSEYTQEDRAKIRELLEKIRSIR